MASLVRMAESPGGIRASLRPRPGRGNWPSGRPGLGGRAAAQHAAVAHQDRPGLAEAPEYVLLDVRHAVALADLLQPRRRLPVFQQRQVGPQVVLDLVVEMALQ